MTEKPKNETKFDRKKRNLPKKIALTEKNN